MLTTDASGTGWGAVASGGPLMAPVRYGGGWSDKQAGCSSNWRETKGGELALRRFGHLADGGRVLLRQDNSCSVSIFNKGHSSSSALMSISRSVPSLRRSLGVDIAPVLIPGKTN